MKPTRTIAARYAGTCGDCNGPVAVGEMILYGGRGRVAHANGTCTLDNVAAGPTTRERKEARADRLEGWAAKREAASDGLYDRARELSDMIPIGQPILVGHHSERRHRKYLDRIDGTMRKAIENDRKATAMASRADGIRAQAERAIYSDDPDVIDALADRIAELEAEKAAIVAYSKAARKKDEEARAAAFNELAPKWRGRADGNNPFPSYATTNLNGNIRRYRQRLAVALAAEAGVPWISDAKDTLTTALAVWNVLGFLTRFPGGAA